VSDLPTSIDDTQARLLAHDYVADRQLATVVYLALKLQRPLFLEGEPGTQGDNLINPDNLNELDRRILKESFRQARKIQTRLKLDYQVG